MRKRNSSRDSTQGTRTSNEATARGSSVRGLWWSLSSFYSRHWHGHILRPAPTPWQTRSVSGEGARRCKEAKRLSESTSMGGERPGTRLKLQQAFEGFSQFDAEWGRFSAFVLQFLSKFWWSRRFRLLFLAWKRKLILNPFQDTYLQSLRIFDDVIEKIADVWTIISIGTELI